MKRSDWLSNTQQDKHTPTNTIQDLMRDGLLTVNQLDPSKTYVFTLGNDSWVPGQEDLRAFADALEEMKDGNSIPTITVSAPMVITEKSNENV